MQKYIFLCMGRGVGARTDTGTRDARLMNNKTQVKSGPNGLILFAGFLHLGCLIDNA